MKTRVKFSINVRHTILILLPFFFVFSSQWFSSLTPGKTMPGDNGDSRFNLIILEYVYQSIFVNQNNVFELPFFFPFQSVGGFSDLHIGSIFGYALPRLLGVGMFASMQAWIAIGCLLNYFASYYVMQKFGIKPIYAIVGSLIFTFGLPVLAQQGHLQLLWRCSTPLAIYFGIKLIDFFQIRILVYFISMLSLSFLFGVYTGVGTLIVSSLIILFRLYFKLKFSVDSYSTSGPLRGAFIPRWKIKLGYLVSFCFILITFLVYFNYWAISRLYQIERSLSETIFFSPKPISWLSSYMSILWAPISRSFPQNDGYWENQLFFGIGTTAALIVAGFFVVHNFKESRFIHPFIFGIVSTIILITLAGKVSIFLVLSLIPGINSVRAPGRISLLLLFPIALVVAWVMQSLVEKRHKAVTYIIFLGILTDLIFTVSYESNISTWIDRPNRIIEKNLDVLNANPDAVIYVVPPDGKEWSGASQLDGMFVAQQLGRRTLNGYSGFTPINAPTDYSCDGVTNWLEANSSELYGDKAFSLKQGMSIVILNEDFSCLITFS